MKLYQVIESGPSIGIPSEIYIYSDSGEKLDLEFCEARAYVAKRIAIFDSKEDAEVYIERIRPKGLAAIGCNTHYHIESFERI